VYAPPLAPGSAGGDGGGGGVPTTVGEEVIAATVRLAPPVERAASRLAAEAKTPEASELAVEAAEAARTWIVTVKTTEPAVMEMVTSEADTPASEAKTACILLTVAAS
jgi:hypothetical protein